MTDEPFSVTTDARGGVAHARLAGELDLSSAPRLDEALRRPELRGSPWLVIDLRELQFMDSTGLRALLTAHSRAAEAGHRLTLVVGEGAVGRLIELTGVRDIVECVDTPPAGVS
jgi:anti-sigma B factor antagonist